MGSTKFLQVSYKLLELLPIDCSLASIIVVWDFSVEVFMAMSGELRDLLLFPFHPHCCLIELSH